MPHRILIVSNFFPPQTVGGAEIVAFRQARALAVRGHEVAVLAGMQPTQQSPPGTLRFDRHEGLPVYRLSLRSLDPSLNFHWPGAAARLRAVVCAHDIEVVHFHNVVGMGANLIPVARAAAGSCLVTLHDHWGFCFQQTRLRKDGSVCQNHEECFQCRDHVKPNEMIALPMRLRRDYVMWCLNQANRLLVPSSYLSFAYAQAGVSATRMTVLSNGIELSLFPSTPKQESPDGKIRFLWSGYLGEHKGVPVLLRALDALGQEASLTGRWQIALAGEGHLRPQVEAAVASPRLKGKANFLGRLPRAQLLDLLRTSDVAVLTSVWPENEPVTLLEAMASGAAQIATRMGGNIGLVENNKTGFVIAPNDPTELADAMRNYILQPSLAARHGQNNFFRRADFDEAHTIDKLENLLLSTQSHDPELASLPPEPVIVCGTGWPPTQVTAMLNRVHDHLLPGLTPRFIWHEWSEPATWKDTVLLWLWDGEPAERLVNEALRRGVPVLAPKTDKAVGLARHYGGVILYRTYLEALATLRTLLSIPTLRTEFSWCASASAASATALAAREAFSLGSESLS